MRFGFCNFVQLSDIGRTGAAAAVGQYFLHRARINAQFAIQAERKYKKMYCWLSIVGQKQHMKVILENRNLTSSTEALK